MRSRQEVKNIVSELYAGILPLYRNIAAEGVRFNA